MKDNKPYVYLIVIIWFGCFVLSSVTRNFEYMYAAAVATLFILLGSA